MNYENLIFDIDGTLWDSRELVAKGYNIQLEKEGLAHLSVTADELKRQFGKVMTAIADSIFGPIPAPERYALLERCMASQYQVLKEDPCNVDYPGVRETIAKLAENHRLFIVSNCEQGYPQLCIEKLGIGEYIQDHLCFGDTGTSKGKTIRTLMAKNNIENAIYIGDTQGDYEATVEAGLPFVWCTYGFGTPEGYVAKVDNFAELLNLF